MKNLITAAAIAMLLMGSCINPQTDETATDDSMQDSLSEPLHPNEDTSGAPMMIDSTLKDTLQ